MRAIYSPDLTPDQVDGTKPLDDHQGSGNIAEPRFALDERDREELVTVMSDFSISKPYKYEPQPMQLDHLMLTSLGGYLKGIGDWEPPKIEFSPTSSRVLTVEEWKQITTLGRDQYVRVVYKGYLAPFTHRASLVKVTERTLYHLGDLVYAMLHQRMYIVVHQPRRDFPLYRQPNEGRQFPFQRVDVLTTVTPDLDDPNSKIPCNIPAGVTVNQSLFWPAVKGVPFPFRFRFWDMEGNTSEASLEVVFGDASISQTQSGCASMVHSTMLVLTLPIEPRP